MTKANKGIIPAKKTSAKGGCGGCGETMEKLTQAIELLAQITQRVAVPMIAVPNMPDCPGTADGTWNIKIKRVNGVCSAFADPV